MSNWLDELCQAAQIDPQKARQMISVMNTEQIRKNLLASADSSKDLFDTSLPNFVSAWFVEIQLKVPEKIAFRGLFFGSGTEIVRSISGVTNALSRRSQTHSINRLRMQLEAATHWGGDPMRQDLRRLLVIAEFLLRPPDRTECKVTAGAEDHS